MMKVCLCSTLGQASSRRVVTTCQLNRLQGPSLSIDLGLCVCLMALAQRWIIFSCFIQTQFRRNRKKTTTKNGGTREEQRQMESTDSHHFCTQRYITFRVYSNECCQYAQSTYVPRLLVSLSPLNPGMK